MSSVPISHNRAKTKKHFQVEVMVTTGGTVSLAEWIIDDTCLVSFLFIDLSLSIAGFFPINRPRCTVTKKTWINKYSEVLRSSKERKKMENFLTSSIKWGVLLSFKKWLISSTSLNASSIKACFYAITLSYSEFCPLYTSGKQCIILNLLF